MKIPTAVEIGVTKDGTVKLHDAETHLLLTRYQAERFCERAPEFRATLDVMRAKFNAAKQARRQRWLSGEPWEPLNIAELTRDFDDLLRTVHAPGRRSPGASAMARVLVDPQPVKRLPQLQLFFDRDAKAFELYDQREQRSLSLQEAHDLLDAGNLRETCTSILVMPAEYRDPLLASLADAHSDPADGIVLFVARVKELLQASH